ncbi:hypothetical protein BKN38_02295 [Helicobacter sp. CLO-3]|nr:hypothetical protein BA723_00735 [Helicobacter sp. CLO-3]OHU84701.1 hypothetical protein BKN38_02295 [Helicobacter sp. CLO-3]
MILAAILLAIFTQGCSKKNAKFHTKVAKDLSIYTQDALAFVPESTSSKTSNATAPNTAPKLAPAKAFTQEPLAKAYLRHHFSPWVNMPINKDTQSVFWVRGSLLKVPGFGENLLPNSLDSTRAIWEKMNTSAYPNANQKAIITESSAVRAVPSDLPRFDKADDYPFDQWQNSLIFANTPVLITHFDTSKQWAHIQSGFVYGWVKTQHLASVSQADIKKLMSPKRYILPLRDKIALYDESGKDENGKDQNSRFVTLARMGQIFGIVAEDKKGYLVFVAKRDENGRAHITKARAKHEDFALFPRAFSHASVATIINTMMGDKYGWGGYLENRDCSAFVRDVFANFGLYLPRNSKSQAIYAKNMVDISKLSRKKKERYIIENGTPFGSVLWQKGHIMLYIGEYGGRAMVAHSAWSVKTSSMGKKYKNMLGGVVITSLYAGKEHSGAFSRTLLIDKIEGISNLFEPIVP